MNPASLVTKVRIRNLLFDEGAWSRPSGETRERMHGRQGRVVKHTDPADDESCLERGRAEIPIAFNTTIPLPPRRDLVAPPDHFNDRKDIVISSVSGPRGVSRRVMSRTYHRRTAPATKTKQNPLISCMCIIKLG